MTKRKERVTLVTGPKMAAELIEQARPLVKRYDELAAANDVDRKELAGIRKDPYANLPPYTHTPLSEIQAWVKMRDEQSAPLEEQITKRGEEMVGLSRVISAKTREEEEIQKVVSERQRRLNELKTERARQGTFRSGLHADSVFRDFVEYQSGRILKFIDSAGIELCGWDETDRELRSTDASFERGLWPPSQRGFVLPWRLASVKTMAAASGQLIRELGYPLRRSVAGSLVESLSNAGIRSVLEVGPGSRGIVDVLAESGIAEKAGLALYAVDMRVSEKRRTAMENAGIIFIKGNAAEADALFPETKFDLILAVGVMSAGGIQDGEGAEDYAGFVEKSHQIADGLARVLSDNPHAMLACSGIHGTMTLFKDRLQQNYRIAYWQTPCTEARENDRKKAFPDCPIRPGELYHTREQGYRFREWARENAVRLEFADRLFEQSTDLAVLKRK